MTEPRRESPGALLDYGRRLLVRRDSDRECHQPPNGNATRSRRVRVLVEVRPNLPLALIPRLDIFSDSGPSLNRFLSPQFMSGVSTGHNGGHQVDHEGD